MFYGIPCDACEDAGCMDCKHCEYGNPCYGCSDYDDIKDCCTSDGACSGNLFLEREDD